MRIRRLLLTGLLIGTVSAGVCACAPIYALNTVTITRGLVVAQNLPYGNDPRQKLDVYAQPGRKDAPVVVFVHGGNWTSGSKDEYVFLGDSLARAGFVAVVISYRLAPTVQYPGFVRDTVRALRWAKDHAGRYGGDPKRLFVMGHSAGAFNAAAATVRRDLLAEQGLSPSDLRGVIGLAGPYDYDPAYSREKRVYPPGATRNRVMPAAQVTPGLPPFLLLVAARDQIVSPENGTRMRVALEANRVPVRYLEVPGVDHFSLMGAMARRLTFLGPVRDEVIRFVREHAE
ncbi:acetyl esterase/lipase [Deinobacterium chartae]|uniref:Acetyl esterase/lipase n=1 Tax=Deinobacterium chartae TaxID=521158 RepID=A0A841HWR1_9DEIO|nr:alpha/beta hydrolase [Deinobacterium chartae]MBB6097293.1 acetyl esterase/lipase [Deinobacterium chartae]